MKIEIWSDFACPFCYIGKHHLEQAIGSRTDIEVEFKSFELDPQTAIHHDENIHELIAKKYGMSYEQAYENNQRIIQMAAEAGLTFNFDQMKTTNTFNAHRLTQFAKTKGKGNEFAEAALHEYFSNGAFLNDETTLLSIATSVGLAEQEVLEVIRSETYDTEVRNDEEQARQLDITSVPFFLIDGKYAVSGAQPVTAFQSVLAQVDEKNQREKPIILNTDESVPHCDDDHCAIL
ncbi:DsbA family oxidoreductase [Isobaculum melis]|uniref:Predicted dithiol-disulfide isomerase, DsbA family n=1 Tax=Isobaculum melis TaxID=142588 RepID=A0A1H9R6B7_9LACT|nr:DsbA family oxidoreductase [Isobaculum melis]SER68230.1 Predicted dithiol-disulfide isomerase, DsbA family [Isobaculum melis]